VFDSGFMFNTVCNT